MGNYFHRILIQQNQWVYKKVFFFQTSHIFVFKILNILYGYLILLGTTG